MLGSSKGIGAWQRALSKCLASVPIPDRWVSWLHLAHFHYQVYTYSVSPTWMALHITSPSPSTVMVPYTIIRKQPGYRHCPLIKYSFLEMILNCMPLSLTLSASQPELVFDFLVVCSFSPQGVCTGLSYWQNISFFSCSFCSSWPKHHLPREDFPVAWAHDPLHSWALPMLCDCAAQPLP